MDIARVFLDQDMRQSFDGLRAVLRKAQIDPTKLKPKSFIIFMNRKASRFKMLIGNDYLVYHNNGNRRIPLEAITHLPSCFNGEAFDFNKAIEKTIKAKLRLD